MKLGINAIGLFPGRIGGAEQYIRNVVKYLEEKKDIDLYLFLNSDSANSFEESDKLKIFPVFIGDNIETQLSYYIDYFNLDVWFCPLFHLNPEKCPIPSAVAIFDIQQEYFPSNFSFKELTYRKKLTKLTCERADTLITISDFSKQTIIDKYQVESSRIHVTHLDSDSTFYNSVLEVRKEEVRREYDLPDEYFFYPANSWPHKNHLRLIKAYHKLKKSYGVTAKVVFSGAKKERQKDIDRYIKKNDLEKDIIYLGYVRQEDMPYLFANSCITVFPSLFEGFGIPLIEAMRSGVPLVCSRSGSIPEVAADAACYFDGYSVNDIAEVIYKVYSDKDLQKQLIQAGKLRAKDFSWEKCVSETASILESLWDKPADEPDLDCDGFPLVSIITPSYNQGQFIKETIDSVLSQDYPNIEYIVMDGGSTDDTVEILKSYSDRITWVSEKDGGQADAVNKGLRIAKGQIIGWLNSDDTYLEGAISKAVAFLESHPRTDMVYGEGYYIDKRSQITGRYDTEKYNISRLAETCIICQPTAFFRKQLSDNVGGLDPDLHLCMDYDLWMRFAFKGTISYMPEYLATSRMYEENKTLSRRSDVFREVCSTVKRHYNYVPFSWASGHAHYLAGQTAGRRFALGRIILFCFYNLTNPIYLVTTMLKMLYRKTQASAAIAETTDRYLDNWLGRRYVTALSLRKNSAVIEIMGGHHWPLSDPLVIELTVNAHNAGKYTVIEKGPFYLECILESPLEPGLHNVELQMNKTFNLAKMKQGNDPRNLSFQLDSISFR
jgi:glycosyltransferase involved in cell wall biosynthesis